MQPLTGQVIDREVVKSKATSGTVEITRDDIERQRDQDEALPLRGITAAEVTCTLYHEVFSRFGLPEEIHSDQGQQFIC